MPSTRQPRAAPAPWTSSPADRSFNRRYGISYRGVKLPRASAALRRFWVRREVGLPQVAQPSEGLPPVIRPARISRAGTDEPLAPIEDRSVRAVFPRAIWTGSGSKGLLPAHCLFDQPNDHHQDPSSNTARGDLTDNRANIEATRSSQVGPGSAAD